MGKSHVSKPIPRPVVNPAAQTHDLNRQVPSRPATAIPVASSTNQHEQKAAKVEKSVAERSNRWQLKGKNKKGKKQVFDKDKPFPGKDSTWQEIDMDGFSAPEKKRGAQVDSRRLLQNWKSVGKPLPDIVKAEMEQMLGSDFSHVRLHDGSESARLTDAYRADALTQGEDIYFAPGKLCPDSTAGKALLAHELTHVTQQATMPPVIQRKMKSGTHGDAAAADTDRKGPGLFLLLEKSSVDFHPFLRELEEVSGLKLWYESSQKPNEPIRELKVGLEANGDVNMIRTGPLATGAQVIYDVVTANGMRGENSVIVALGDNHGDWPKFIPAATKTQVKIDAQLANHIHGEFFSWVITHEFREQILASSNIRAGKRIPVDMTQRNVAHEGILALDAKTLLSYFPGKTFDLSNVSPGLPPSDPLATGSLGELRKSGDVYLDSNGNGLKYEIIEIIKEVNGKKVSEFLEMSVAYMPAGGEWETSVPISNQ